jgi:hypothetical protein
VFAGASVYLVMGVWCTVTEIGPDEVALAEWSLRGTGMPSIEIVDCLAQLHLELQRRGGRLALSDVCEDLAGLLELSGLTTLSES